MSKIGDGYRELDACANCKFCAINSIQDDGEAYYCNFDDTLKPGVLNGGYPTDVPFDVRAEWWDAHSVIPYGICDKYERGEV